MRIIVIIIPFQVCIASVYTILYKSIMHHAVYQHLLFLLWFENADRKFISNETFTFTLSLSDDVRNELNIFVFPFGMPFGGCSMFPSFRSIEKCFKSFNSHFMQWVRKPSQNTLWISNVHNVHFCTYQT